MTIADRFTVTITRLNKGLDDESYHKVTGHTLTVSKEGVLSVESDKGVFTYAAGLWDDLELKMFPLDKKSLTDPG